MDRMTGKKKSKTGRSERLKGKVSSESGRSERKPDH